MNKENIKLLIHNDYELDYINKYNKKISFSSRTFNELLSNNVISSKDYIGDSIIYETNKKDNLAVSKFAIIDNVAYLSWIWVSEPLRGEKYGQKLVSETINYLIKSYNISVIYTIPKSDIAKYIFKKKGFKNSNVNGYLKLEI